MQDDTARIRRIYRRLSHRSQKIRNLLADESDRGCALWAASLLDEKLKDMWRSILAGNKKEVEALLNNMGPLSTFSARVKLAYNLGIFDKDRYKEYTAIRKIRNEFAHSSDTLDYSSPKISDFCSKLRLPDIRGDALTNREKYTMSVTLLIEFLEQAIEKLEPLVLKNVYLTLMEAETAVDQRMRDEKGM